MQNNINKGNKGYNLYNFEYNFREYLSAVIKLSQISIKNYLSDFRFFCGWFESNIDSNKNDLQFLTVEVLEAYKQYLIANLLPTKTINRRLSSIRKFCGFALSQGWIEENPARKIKNYGVKEKTSEVEKFYMEDFSLYLKAQDVSKDRITTYVNDVNEFLEVSLLN